MGRIDAITHKLQGRLPWGAPSAQPAEVDLAIAELRKALASSVGQLPWQYGQDRIDGRIFPKDHIWSVDGKTLARSAVNALPLLIGEIERLRAELTAFTLATGLAPRPPSATDTTGGARG